MRKLLGVMFTSILICYTASSADLYTYGLVSDIRYNYDYVNGTYVYDTVYVSAEISQPRLSSVSLKVEPRGSYLDITENALISPSIPSDDGFLRPPYYVKGTIGLPEGSSIVSFSVTCDTNVYSAKVLPEFPLDYEVDTTLGDDVASLKWQNQHYQSDEDRYQLQLNSVEAGREYQIQIRYLVPNRGSASPAFSLGILNHSYAGTPNFFELKYSASSEINPYKLKIGDMSYPLSADMAIQIPYQQNFEISSVDSSYTRMHVTDIENGPWQGKYLILNTSVPDSVLVSMSKSIETVFLWRWNRPSSFVTRSRYYGSEASFLSNYGYQAVSQASSIREMINYLTRIGNKTGMVHSIQYKEPEVFPLCGNKGSAFAKLDGYLSQFTEDYFLNSGYFEYDTRPDDPIPTGPVDSSKAEFKRSLKLVHGLYSNGNGILKHLIVVCAGPVQISRDMITIEEIDTLVGDLSVDCENAVWRDVSFNLVKTISLNSDLVRLGNFKFPEFRPSSMLLQVESETKTYSFPIAPDQASFSIVAKSEGAWSPELTWKGFNSSGEPVGTVNADASLFEAQEDTGLVKIWASSADRLSETEETEIGLKYGVISESSSLRIFSSFKGYDSTTSAYASASPVYWKETTGSSVSDFSSNARIREFKCSFLKGLLRILLPDDEKIQRIRIFSLAGRLLADFNPADYRTVEGYLIPRSFLSGIAGNSMVIVRVEGEKWVRSQKVVLGR